MRRILLTLLTGIVLNQAAYSQKNVLDGVYIKGDSEIIKNINKVREETLANINSYQKEEAFKDKDGTSFRYVYRQNKELKLIAVKTMDGNVEKRVSWYFNNGQLIFSEQIWTDNESNKLIDHEQFYTDYGNLIAMIKNDKPVATTSDEFKEVSKGLKSYAEKLKEQVSK